MSDWIVNLEERTVTHGPSSSHCSFYKYPNPENVTAPNVLKPGPNWDRFFSSHQELCEAATNAFRAKLGLSLLSSSGGS